MKSIFTFLLCFFFAGNSYAQNNAKTHKIPSSEVKTIEGKPFNTKYQTWYNHNPVDVPDYVHRHVLRSSVNTTFVQALSTYPGKGSKIKKTFTYQLNSSWVPANCSIVAAVYRESTHEIIQAEEKHVTQ